MFVLTLPSSHSNATHLHSNGLLAKYLLTDGPFHAIIFHDSRPSTHRGPPSRVISHSSPLSSAVFCAPWRHFPFWSSLFSTTCALFCTYGGGGCGLFSFHSFTPLARSCSPPPLVCHPATPFRINTCRQVPRFGRNQPNSRRPTTFRINTSTTSHKC
jgi:hypothetical protein